MDGVRGIRDRRTRTTTNGRHDMEFTVWKLARLGGCADPDTADSPGARFLDGIARDVADRVEDWTEDTATEVADAAVPVYTYPMWQTFTDLAAWSEDPTDLGADGSDMTAAAALCLYAIAERLAHAVRDQIEESTTTEGD